jgi:hypothetical protein
MGLDVYVMPLWRFKVGNFDLPIEAAVGIRPKIITAEGIEERPARAGWLGRWRARRQVAAIRKAVEAANDAPVRWADEGGVVYAEQSCGFDAPTSWNMTVSPGTISRATSSGWSKWSRT